MEYAAIEELTLSGSPLPTTIGEYDVIEARFADGLIYVFDFGDNQYAIFAARSGEGGFAEFEDEAIAMAENRGI